MNQTFSRELLQGLHQQHRQAILANVINQYHNQIVTAATAGSLTCILDLGPYFNRLNRKTITTEYVPNVEDIVEGLKRKYPGCLVVYTEEWIETTPGTKQQKQHILIDWS